MIRNEHRTNHATTGGNNGLRICRHLARFGWRTAAALSVAALSGCSDGEVKVYRVEKEGAGQPVAAHGQMPAGHPEVARAKPRLTWTTPAGWTEAPAGEFRVASFSIKGEDGKQAGVGVFPLPGSAGGDLANVNRWRSEVGLEEVNAEAMEKLAQKVEIAGQSADLYELAGRTAGSDEPARILGVIQHRDGTAWFYKMTGDDELVAQQKTTFIGFLKSLKLESPQMAGLPPSHPPIDGASMAAQAASAVSSGEGKPRWNVPEGWREIPGGQFLVAKFNIVGDGSARADVNVSTSSGDGGGLLANVNRWRQQLGLSAISAADLASGAKSVEIAGGKATLVDMSGTDARTGQPARVIGAMVPQSGQTWFYKLMGESKLVETQKEAFTKFVQTVRY